MEVIVEILNLIEDGSDVQEIIDALGDFPLPSEVEVHKIKIEEK